jgi:hypothetical protein
MRSLVPRVLLVGLCLLSTPLRAQQATAPTVTTVPRLVGVTGSFTPADGLPAAQVETLTLSIYSEETGGEPIWQETQKVVIGAEGRYSVLLGASAPDGLPLHVFASGTARWISRRFERPGEGEPARVLMVSVPYALKASDADTLGGLPASAFLLAQPDGEGGSSTARHSATRAANTTSEPATFDLTAGSPNFVGKFINGSDLGNSAIYDAGGLVGVNTTTPFDGVHVRFINTNGTMTGYAVQNMGNTGVSYSGMLFYDQNSALGLFQGFGNVTHEYRINNVASNGTINFMIGSASRFLVRNDGDIDIAGSIRQNGTLVVRASGFDTAVGFGALRNTASLLSSAFGYGALGDINNTGQFNSAFGQSALEKNTMGESNSAFGHNALSSNTAGAFNSAFGDNALLANTSGALNAAFGVAALRDNTTGTFNSAVNFALVFNTTGDDNSGFGHSALLRNTTGGDNSAYGFQALTSNTSGHFNTAIGVRALSGNSTGSRNIALGSSAGSSLGDGNDNIFIGSPGTAGDNATIRIGGLLHTRFFASGIRGTTTAIANAVAVVVDSNGQLGTVNSSRRYKEDIQDMGDASSGLMKLRPVTYRYQQPYADGSKPIDYGLIAEEVEEIYPDLVAHLADGEVETVQYQKVNAMLLNEVQKQHRTIEELKARLDALERLLSAERR